VQGQHKGFWYHTIGQRQGLGLAGGPWYVVAKDIAKNIIFISRDYYSPDKQRDAFCTMNHHWIAGHAPEKKDIHVKLRHGAQSYACTWRAIDDQSIQVTLASRDQGIAPGQVAVLYDDQICLGSGVIKSM
jgi:tRNA-specific 2-thiouridylase